MADKKVILEIEYDTDEAQKSADALALKIDGLRETSKKYNEQVRNARKDLRKTDDQLKEEGKTRESLNKIIREGAVASARVKDQMKSASRERAKTIKEINGEKSAFDQLTENIKENTEAQNRNTQALDEIPGAAGNFVSSVKGMIQTAKAFIATPLGLVLTAIVGTLAALRKAFNRSEESGNKLKIATSAISGVFNGLMKVLEPVAVFLAEKIGKAFEFVGNVADKAMGLLSKGLRKLGFEGAADRVDNFTESIKESTSVAQELAAAEAELTKQQRWARKIQLDYQKDAERLRQIRDDEALSIQERMKANEELGKVLQEQLQEEMKIANQALKVAELRIQLEGETTQNLDARAEAMTNIADIQERIAGQESEQLVNINSLKREQLQLEKERQAEAEKAAKAEEERLKKEEEAAKKAAEEREKEQQKELERRAEAIQKMAELERQRLIDEAETFEERKEQLIKQAEEELELKLELKGITDEEIELAEAEHKARLAAIDSEYNAQVAAHREANLQQAFDSMQRVIAATQGMADQRVTIISDAFSKISTINWKEVETGKEGFMAIASASSGLTALIGANREQELADLEAKKAYELSLVGDNAEAQDAINRKYANEAAKIKKQQAEDDKTAAIIDATIATAIGVVQALANPGGIAGIILAALVGALGAVQIASIASQPIPNFKTYAKGGIIGGKPHSQGGTKFYGEDGSLFEAERGESMFVMKKDATAEIAALSAINESHGGRSFFERGAPKLQEGGEVDTTNIQRTVQEEFQRTPIFVRTGDIETGLTERQRVKDAGVV